MGDTEYWIPTGVFGLLAIFTGVATVTSYRKYKHAKKRHEEAQKMKMVSVQEAALSRNRVPQYACVEGWIERLGPEQKVLSFTYDRLLSIPGYRNEEHLADKLYAAFALRDGLGNKVFVAPSEKLHMLTLVRKEEQSANWFNTLLFTLTRVGILLGTVEYFAYDGDYIILFGLLSYDPLRERTVLLPKLVTTSGYDDILKYIKNSVSLWQPFAISLVFVAATAAAGYFGYRAYQRSRARNVH